MIGIPAFNEEKNIGSIIMKLKNSRHKISIIIYIFCIVFFKDIFAESKYNFIKLKNEIDVSQVSFYHKNTKIKIEDFEQKLVIVNLWATWCAPCLKEMPSLDKLAGKLNKNKFYILPLSQDGGGSSIIKKFYERLNIENLDIFFDPSHTFANAVFLRGLPSTYIVKKGKVLAVLEGEINWDKKEIINQLEAFY